MNAVAVIPEQFERWRKPGDEQLGLASEQGPQEGTVSQNSGTALMLPIWGTRHSRARQSSCSGIGKEAADVWSFLSVC